MLRNMDTTKTLYKSERRQKPEEETQDVDNKVNMICEAFRTLLMGIDRKKYIQSILSTYVKSSPPDLESALQLLAEIRGNWIVPCFLQDFYFYSFSFLSSF